MNRIDATFARQRAAGRTVLIPYVTAGDPSLAATDEVLDALTRSGADVIELGVPFSDPMADGPVIQRASERELAQHVGLRDVLDLVARFRLRNSAMPIVLMGYLNPIEIYGHARFAADAVAAGVDGVLLVDCPLEEDDTAQVIRAAGLRQIHLAAPTTEPERLDQLCRRAEGFLYYVSFAGITGALRLSTADIAQRVATIRAASRAPVAVGFGVRDADSAVAIAGYADAVVIGSALVERIAGSADAAETCARARAFLAPIRDALNARAAA
ncbi:MAG: tryptophan synthase subunit alpha [Betaproteobacteria bacterium]|nr:tryptophan synthase subunit alpha [Betaproteobacteria bacterium]